MPKLKPTDICPTPEEDAAIMAGIAEDPDEYEETPELWKYARPATEVMPNFIERWKRNGGVKNKRPLKREEESHVAVWLDEDVVAYYRAGGMDTWRQRVHDVLRRAMDAERSKDAKS